APVETVSVSQAVPVKIPVPQSKPDYRLWVSLLWLAGCVLFFVLAVGKALRIAVKLRQQRMPLAAQQQATVQALAAMLGYKRPIRVWRVNGLAQPFVWGLPRGAIYVPSALWTQYTESRIRCALAHELNHVMRWDASINALQILAQAVFWFHPLVWWTNRRLRHEREKCCDEAAIAMLSTTSDEYGQAIVETLAVSRHGSSIQGSLAIAGPLKSIEERLRSIMKPNKQFHKRASLINVLGIGLIGLVLVPTAWEPTRAVVAMPMVEQSLESALTQDVRAPAQPQKILISAKYYLVDTSPSDSDGPVAPSVRVDETYAKKLAGLALQGKGVKCVASPSTMAWDGKSATMSIKAAEYFILAPAGFRQGNPGQKKLDGINSGVSLSVTGIIREGGAAVFLGIETHLSDARFPKHPSSKEIPFEVTSGLKTGITTKNGKPVVISGLSASEDRSQFIVAVITPSIIERSHSKPPYAESVEKEVPAREPLPPKPVASRPAMGAVERLQKRTQFIQNDPMVKALTAKIVELELKLMEYSLDMGPDHAHVESTHKMLDTVSRRLRGQTDEIGHRFDQAVEEENQAGVGSR
ncbi:MAG: hypothetical protein GY809_14435, partial [Planctomycetes bacterium]|nr:hypothetical protein [Planctomycetota bacterium]